MKAVKRKNGTMMADLYIKFTVAAGHLVKVVSIDLAERAITGERIRYSRTNVEQLLRECLKESGDSMLQLDDEFEDSAWIIVQKLFPEMCAPS